MTVGFIFADRGEDWIYPISLIVSPRFKKLEIIYMLLCLWVDMSNKYFSLIELCPQDLQHRADLFRRLYPSDKLFTKSKQYVFWRIFCKSF